MDQLRRILASLSGKQKISIAIVALMIGAGLFALTRWQKERDFRMLYSGMAAEDAAAVVQKLKESGVEFRLSDNGTAVQVPSARAAELRLQMAAAGLPKTGRAGFELFDKANFGATDFTEHVNFRRALEGELERSVMALAEVQSARVHVTFPKDSIFLEARQAAKASVMVRLRPGASLSAQNVSALCQLVSSAVEGLAPEAVSVLDMSGNLLSRRRAALDSGDQPSEASLDYRRQIERDLLTKINSTLEPLLGPEKFRAGVSVECDFSSGEQSEESYDPAKSVMTASQKTEDVSGGSISSGVPGTASNLPRAVSRPGTGSTGTTHRTESVTYQSSRLVKHVRLPQGNLRRMSVSVLVDQVVRWEGAGAKAKRVFEPPTPEKLKTIRDLVAGAIGLSADRGDQLIVETLPFDSTLRLEPPPDPSTVNPAPAPTVWPPALAPYMTQKNLPIVAGVVAALVLLAVAGAFFAGRRKKKGARQVSMKQELPGGRPGSVPTAVEAGGNSAQHQLEAQLADNEARRQKLEMEGMAALKMPEATTKKAEVLTKYLIDNVKKDPVAAAQIIRTWLHEDRKA
jgi:flagellar M-ring protein FliF